MTTIGISSSQNGSNNVVPPVAIPLHNTIIPHGEKSKKFAGVDFKRWQQKILFYLTTLNLVKFLKETSPTTKYKTEDAGTKKFTVGKFLDYKMVDSKIVISQVQEIQVLLHDIHAEKLELSESFQAPNYAPRRDNSKKAKKFKGNCYNYGKAGHHLSECRKPKKNAQAHMVANNTLSDGLQEMSLSAVVSECNMIENTREWWIDTGATRHENTSSNKRTYETTDGTSNEEELRRSKRARTSKKFGPNFLTYMVEDDPKTFNEAMSTPEAPH
ncbi:uncharacterized protein LOC111389308 [Olea europaea var. sylvestris]|uniref:uncharacterized protein LOC111389308 n=1 Tax=Olea europaea var. sylvestris TaxID=158386 RepID=UPI000C1CF1F9|nr:uncharacterized protein LOC111389308 [Olea europaea var. sylvestris]